MLGTSYEAILDIRVRFGGGCANGDRHNQKT